MKEALLVTPLPPLPTGLADYALRILHLTRGHVDWTVAYPSGAQPIEGTRCVPISSLGPYELQLSAVYQVGNSLHCAEVIGLLLRHPGMVLFHETNLHHVLRQIANENNDWKQYAVHVRNDYGADAAKVLKRMGRKAGSRAEYDSRLRNNPLTGTLVNSATSVAVLSDTAKIRMKSLVRDKKVRRMGFLPDFLERVASPEKKTGTRIIGIAGSYHYGRNWEDMLAAVEKLRECHECTLLAAGGGWPSTDLDWVERTGRLSDLDFRKKIELFDIALDLRTNTCSETSGSMMDILRSGKPAVITAEGSFRDIPADAVLRIPAESGSSGAFYAMRYLLDNPDVMSSISRKAGEYFASVSDSNKCLGEWLRLLGGDSDEN